MEKVKVERSPSFVRVPAPGHDRDTTPPAPGELEAVREFLSLHDHEPGTTSSRAPSAGTIAAWLRESGLVDSDAAASDKDLTWAGEVLEAMRAKVGENMGAPRDDRAIATLNHAAREAGVRLCFGCDDDGRLHASASGLKGAVGRLLGLAFIAELEGTWGHFKDCGSPTCRSIFYDRSKNHSGRWCSMQSCGNRAKVRAWRERQDTEA